MADIRINALATTAASTASDDYVAIDGSANGTRKLSAYSPTFGGNVTVNGTDVKVNNAAGYFYVDSGSSATGMVLSRTNNILELLTANTTRLTISSAGNTTLSGNLTVSGTGGVTSSGTIWGFLANNATQNGYAFYASGASADQKYWHWQNGTAVGDGTLRLRALNDALTSGTNALIITRTGISSTAVEVGGNLTVSGTGNNVFNVGGGNILVGGASDLGPKLQVAAARGNAATSGTTQAGMLRLTPNDGGSGTLDMGIRTSGGYAWLQVSDRTDLSINYAMLLQPNGGNVLLGTTTDGGQKLQVAGSAVIGSTSFELFGTDGTAQFYAASGGTAQLTLTSAGNYDWRIRGTSTTMVFRRDSTDMLSLDGSSNATFAGTIKPQQAATASAPTYVKGAIYFDTTLNKLRVGGATGWETITSV